MKREFAAMNPDDVKAEYSTGLGVDQILVLNPSLLAIVSPI